MAMPTSADMMLAPDSNGVAPRKAQLITGAASTSHATAMKVGQMATLIVSSDTPVHLQWGDTAGTATTSDVEFAANQRFDWMVETNTQFVTGLPVTGTMKVWVWQSSGAA